MAKVKSKRVPVKVDPITYQGLKSYSKLTGRSVAYILQRAVSEWVEFLGESWADHMAQASNRAVQENKRRK